MKPDRAVVLLGVAVAAWLFAAPARAHAVGISRGEYVVTPAGVDATLLFARGELAQAVPELDTDGDGALDDAELGRAAARAGVSREILATLDVLVDDARCTPSLETLALVEGDGALVQARYACERAGSQVTIDARFFDAMPQGHRQVASLVWGASRAEDVLYQGHEHLMLAAPGATAPARRLGIFGFLRLGVEHILTGYDHLLFLVGLILVGGRTRSLVATVTAFTLAHSITLALAVLGVWTPSARVIEPAIALSIAYVGIENLFVKSGEHRWRITFPFGLVHGFGFASVLREIELPRADVPIALVGFNLGVELGQLAVLAFALPLVLAARRSPWFASTGVKALSGAIALAGLVWFVRRAIA